MPPKLVLPTDDSLKSPSLLGRLKWVVLGVLLLLILFVIVYEIKQTPVKPEPDPIPLIVAETPKDAEGYYELGVIYYESGEYDKAIENFDKAINRKRTYADAYYNLSLSYIGRALAYLDKDSTTEGEADLDQAIEKYNTALNQEPQLAAIGDSKFDAMFTKRNLTDMETGMLERAIAYFTKAIAHDSTNAKPHYNRGKFYQMKGEWDLAIDDYTETIRLDRKYTEAYNSRGEVYGMKGEFDRTIADYTEAIRLDSKNALAYLLRGAAYVDKGEFDRVRP